MRFSQSTGKVVLLILLCLAGFAAVSSQEDAWLEEIIKLKGGEQKIETVLNQLVDLGISISYRNDQLPDRSIEVYNRKQSIRQWLDELLYPTELTYEAVGKEKSVVIFPDPAIVNRSFTLYGTIYDASSGERLILANLLVRNRNQGVSSNEFGLYALNISGGRLELQASYVGYQQAEFDFVLRGDSTMNIYLQPNYDLQQIIVTANSDSMIGVNPDAGGIRIGMNEVEQLSGIGGEGDPIQLASLLAGITTGADGIGGINIRGSDASQNLILLDGVPVYNLNHAGGLFSIFNSQAIRRVDLYKNGLPARFGGRLSGVLDVHTRDGNLYQNEVHFSQSLLATRLTAEGPLVEGESSFLVSGRYFGASALVPSLSRSYKARNGKIGRAGYLLYDLNFKLNHKVSEKDHIYFSFYKGLDDFENNTDFRDEITVLGSVVGTVFNYEVLERRAQNISWGNSVGALRWNHVFNDQLFGNLSLTYSDLNLRAGFIRQDSLLETGNDLISSGTSSTGTFSSDIRQIGLAFDGQWLPKVGREIRFGGQFNVHRFQPLILGSNSIDIFDHEFTFPEAQLHEPTELNGYLAYVLKRPDRQFRIGLRAQYWRVGNGAGHLNLSPRLLYTYRLTPWLVSQTTFDVTSQPVHLLGSATIGLPTDIWVPSTKDIAPSMAYQFSTAAKFTFSQSWAGEVAVYAKEMENLVEYLNQEDTTGNWQDQLSIGRGRAYGAEFTLRKQRGPIRGWLSYTLARTERTFDARVNEGLTFPFRYDRQHSISAMVSWHPNANSSLTLSWRYGTGAAYSFDLRSYNLPLPSEIDNPDIASSRNSLRLPPMHRLDINFRIRLPGPKAAKFTHTFDIGLYNAYDRSNEIFYDLRTFYERVLSELDIKRRFVKVYIAPLLPIFSYQMHFKGRRKDKFSLYVR